MKKCSCEVAYYIGIFSQFEKVASTKKKNTENYLYFKRKN